MTGAQRRLRGKVRDGTVVSEKMRKTVIVAIEANFRHRLYKKTVRRVRRLMAHDELEEAHLGDRVRIVESSPISRHKRWRLLDVLIRAELPEVAPESIDLEVLGEVKAEEPEAPPAAAGTEPAGEEPVPAEAVAGPEAEAGVHEEVDVAEEVPEVESAVDEEPEQAEAEAEPESAGQAEDGAEEAAGEPEPAGQAEDGAEEAAGEPEPAGQAEDGAEEAAGEPETEDEDKPS